MLFPMIVVLLVGLSGISRMPDVLADGFQAPEIDSYHKLKYHQTLLKLPRKCQGKSSWLIDYLNLHREILEAKRPPRFFVVRPFSNCGMGNRLRSILGGFQLAVVTGRAFFIDWAYHYKDKDTKKESSVLDPHAFDWSKRTFDEAVQKHTEKANSTLTEFELCARDPRGRKCLGSVGNAFFEEDMFRPHDQVIYQMMWNIIPYETMWKNQNYTNRAQELGVSLDKDIWQECAMRILFQPNPNVSSEFCERTKLWQAEGFPLIGIHVRSGKYHNNRTDYLESFVRCANGIVDGFQEMKNSASLYLLKKLQKYNQSVWVMAADNQFLIEHVRENVQNVTIFSNGEDLRYHSGFGSTRDSDGPFLDLFMLAQAPFGIGSLYSSFTQLGWTVGMIPQEQSLELQTTFINVFPREKIRAAFLLIAKELRENPYQFCREKALNSTLSLHSFLDSLSPFVMCHL